MLTSEFVNLLLQSFEARAGDVIGDTVRHAVGSTERSTKLSTQWCAQRSVQWRAQRRAQGCVEALATGLVAGRLALVRFRDLRQRDLRPGRVAVCKQYIYV